MYISTQRLELREAEDTDVAHLSAYQVDPRYLEHYSTTPDAADIIAKARSWAMETPRSNYQFVITLAGESPAIGCAGVRGRGYSRLEAEIGIELSPDYWGFGYASEALRELITFSESVGIAVVHATTALANVRAHRLFMGAGFSRIGRNRDAVLLRRGNLTTSSNQTSAEQGGDDQSPTR